MVKRKLRKVIVKGMCRLKGCSNTPYCRGICHHHGQCLVDEGTYEKFAAPDRMARKYKRKRNFDGKTCLILGCSDDLFARGICTKHTNQLRRRGIFEKFALASKNKVMK